MASCEDRTLPFVDAVTANNVWWHSTGLLVRQCPDFNGTSLIPQTHLSPPFVHTFKFLPDSSSDKTLVLSKEAVGTAATGKLAKLLEDPQARQMHATEMAAAAR